MAERSHGEHSVHLARGGQTTADLALADLLAEANVSVLLGSKSFARRRILSEMGLKYDVVVADIDEKAVRKETPEALVSALAEAKAAAIVERLRARRDGLDAYSENARRGFLITCDQVVVYEGVVREKPNDETEARAFVKSYGANPATTVGATTVTDLLTGEQFTALDTASIVFEEIPDEVVDVLLREGDCMHCAGGLMVEHPRLAPLTVEMIGSMDSLMGLSKAVAGGLLAEALEARKRGTHPSERSND
jgi:septum formation protein